jgi:hypothetical protein
MLTTRSDNCLAKPKRPQRQYYFGDTYFGDSAFN